MFSDKLLSLLQRFSRYELNRFRKLLLSPYFNDQDDVLRLFDLIDDALRNDPGRLETLDKPAVWQALFPKRRFDDAQLRRLASDLTGLAQRFLVEEFRQNDPLSEAIDLQKALENLDLPKHLAGAERQIERLLERQPGKSTEFYLARFRQQWNIFSRASKIVATSGYTDKLGDADFALECFYLAQKLKLYVAWMLYSGFRNTEQEVSMMPGFWEYLEQDRFAAVALLRIYRRTIRCFAEPENETLYREWLTDLSASAVELAETDLRECYFMAQNYCALKINQGKSEYYREMFELFRKMVDQDILVENGQLPEAVFKNVITVSLRSDEYEWAENFINNYIQYLPASIRENARVFNFANLYSHQKKHSQVIELLRGVEYSDVVYSLGSKLILIRTYYDLQEYAALDSLIDSFRIFLRRSKVLSKNLKREYNNFLNLVRKLSNYNPANPNDLLTLKKRVHEVSYTTPKRWLLEKIQELER